MAGSISNTETQPLLPASTPAPDSTVPGHDKEPKSIPLGFLIVAIAGVFLANADTSLVVATHGSIASEFNSFSSSPWLLTGYTLGYSVALPAYGATSDEFGFRLPLLIAYSLLGSGCIISGTAASLQQIIIGRVVSGLGGAGTTAMVAIILTEIAPLSKVAVLRSYVNIAAVVGRSAGGPIGGLLIDHIGWRWPFIAQAPILAVCVVVFQAQSLPKGNDSVVSGRKKRGLDFLGLMAFALLTTSVLLLVDFAGRGVRVEDPLMLSLLAVFAFFAITFGLIEVYWAKEPVISPSLLLKQGAGPYCLVQIFLLCAQFTLISNIATYFVRTENASNTIAALHIIPAPVGNAIGALLGGRLISKTKRYKLLSIAAAFLCITSFILITLRWQGRINVWESLYILPASLGVGLLNSSQFIGLSAAVEKAQMAKAISIFFLSQQIGMILGASASSALLRSAFRDALVRKIGHLADGDQIIRGILHDPKYALSLPSSLQAAALSSYTYGFLFISVLSICSSSLVLPLTLWLPERKIK